ncbi:hypothetical protein, partial [Serratia marcescens]|uniref:hypothetical protein n=1 Tax=Serratia marcescens TaxID=615 RepID=UPI0019545C21
SVSSSIALAMGSVPADWADWLAQMERVKAAGKFAIPDQALVFNSIAEMYGVTGDVSTWALE